MFWFLLTNLRKILSTPTPIRNAKDNHFRMSINHYNKFLHVIDKEMGGNFMGIAEMNIGHLLIYRCQKK